MDGSKNDIITRIRSSLEKAHVEDIPEYIKKLQNNISNDVFQDLFLEGRAAIMFSKAGFSVNMQDSPDLALKFNNEQFYAEVKHFREKEQDRIDAAKMSGLGDEDELVPYGNTVLPAWEQVYNAAKEKIKQYKEHAPNILVIESSSACIEDTEIPSAIDMINEDAPGKYQGFAKLNGILLVSGWNNISQQWRNVFFYCTSNPAVSLRQELFFLLDDIRLG